MGNTRARVRHLVVGTALALPILAGLLYAAFSTSLVATFVPATGGHSLTWEGVTASTSVSKSFYLIVRRYGITQATLATSTGVVVTDQTAATVFPPFSATWSYRVFHIEPSSATTVLSTTTAAAMVVSTSAFTNDATPNAGSGFLYNFTRVDAAGGQTGQGQQWTITYKMNTDANVSFAVFYPTYTPITDSNGFYDADVASVTSGGSAAVVKRILNKVPRSQSMADDSWFNTDVWDVRDSNGTLVPNGIYNIVFSAYQTGGLLLGSRYLTIPVDVLRISNLGATAITDTVPNSNITYNLTGNANIRILIATTTPSGVLPQFTINTASDVVLSTGTTVQILTEVKPAGSVTTIWDGLNLSGNAVSSGLYAFAISVKDTSGNGGVGPSSNDYFITGSISVNRVPPAANLTALSQVQNLNVVWAASDKSATMTWDTAGAGITYSLFRKFGIWRDTTTFFAGVSTVATGITAPTYKDTIGPGTWTYGVRATSGTAGGPISAMTAETSRNRFIRSISAVDGLGGQLGQGGKWIFSYKIEDNAEVDLVVLSTSTLLGADASGFATYLASDVVKVVVSSGPRASEGVGSSWTNSDTWDQTNAAGVQVSSGIYTVLLRSRLPATNPYYPPALRDVVVMQVPVTPAPVVVGQVQNVSVAWAPSDKSATVSWTALAGATGYTVYRKFGIWTSTASFIAGASTVTTGVVGTSYKDTVGPGAWTYGVLGEGVVGTVSSVVLDTSKNRFIQSVTQVDGVGGQLGQGGKWTFTYKLEDNAEVDLVVLSTSSLLGTDANGFATYLASDVVKIAVSSAPRAGMGSAGSVVNTDVWDQTNASGVQVSSGIYMILIRSRLTAANPYYPPAGRDVVAFQVPVLTTQQQAVGQVQGLTVTWAPADKSATLSWTALSGATGYSIYRKFGIWNSTASFFTGASTITTGVVGVTYKDTVGPGAWTYGVRAEGVGGSISAVNLGTSRNRFIHSVSQVDGNGGQSGLGGKWIFSYKLEDNATVDIIVLSTSAVPGTNADGLATYSLADIVKVVVTSAPRAAEGSGSSWVNSDTWDQTNTAGVSVSSGIYTVLIQAHVPGSNPYFPPADRDVYVFQVPVLPTSGQQQVVGQVQNVNVAWASADKSANLSWGALTGATGYSVLRKYGVWLSTSSFFAGASTITTNLTGTTYKDTVGPGAWTYGVKGEGVGGPISAVSLETSKSRFVQSVTRVDGTGGDQGTGGKWTFGYKMEDDAEVDLVVLSTSTLLGTDANGFATYTGTDVVKVVVSSGPRSGMGAGGSVANSDVWDFTNSAGVQVSSGIYTILIRARLSAANPFYPPAQRDVFVFQVPVNAAPVPPVDSLQVQNVKATWNNAAKTVTVTWDTVGLGFLSADAFTLYRKFGVWKDTTTFFTGVSTVASGSSFFNTYTDPVGPGAYTYGVRATRGTGSGPISLLTSDSTRNRFVQTVTRVDGAGGQQGQGGKWTFTYSMEDDANVDIIVLSTSSLTGVDSNGFATYLGSDVVKTVISSAPRSGMGSVSFSNSDFWDMTNSAGVGVSSGIYTVLIRARLSAASLYYPPADRDVFVFQVPVNASPLPTSDALQVTNVKATWNPADKTTTVTWDFVNLSLGGADSYTVLRRFGVWKDTAAFAGGASAIATGNFAFNSYKDTVGPGTYTYGVRAARSGQIGAISLLTVESARNRFIHDVTMVDGAGGQLGLAGNWTFSYKIEENASVDIIVLSSNSFVGADANGFATYLASDVVRYVVANVPRAFEGISASWINSDNWDQKDASGVQVSSGIYTVLIQARLSPSSPFASPQLLRDVAVLQIPVNTTAGTVSTTFLAQVQNVKIDWDPNERSATVLWDSVSGADAYTVFRKFGIWTDTTTFFVNVTTIAAGVAVNSYRDLVGPGAWTYGVRATKAGNLAGPISPLDREFTRNRYIRQVTTLDGAGGQLGMGGRWSFTYKLEDNANVDLIILSPNSLVGLNANGFATYRDSDVVKLVVSSAPRAFQGIDNSVLNSDSWDQTNTAGVQVSSGIYTVLIQAHVGPANKYYGNDIGTGTAIARPDRDVYVFQVPVNTVLPSVGVVSSEIGGSLLVTYTHGTAGNGYTPLLTWKTPVVTGGAPTYRVYRASGSYSFPISSGILVGVTKDPSFTDFISYSAAQDWTYIVEASLPSGSLSYSQYVVLPFLHDFTRADASGSQIGFGQKWKWTYKMLQDAYVTMEVYPATSTFVSNVRGQITGADTVAVKTILAFTPRSFEMKDKSFINADTWDTRNSTGAIVPNGVYNVRFTAYDVTGRVLGSFGGQVPVDTLRIMDVSAVGISQTGGGGTTASVSYTLTGAATVRLTICKASTTFTLDTFGDPQPVQGAGAIISTITFARNPGTYTEIWNGLDSTGKAVPNDLYVFALSAKDGFGNFAVASSSNDFYVAGTIPIDRTQQQPQADITPPNVTATNPQTGATIPPFDKVTVSLVDPVPPAGTPPPTGVNFSSSVIQLTGPAGNTIAGTTSVVGLTDLVFTLSYSTNGTVPGVYVMRITPMDNSLNTASITQVTFQVTLSTPVPPAQIQGLNVAWSPTDKSATISWTAIPAASGYTVYRKFGIWTSTSSFIVGVTTVATGVILPTYKDIVGPGTWTYGVRQEGVGGDVSSVALESSRNRFIRSVSAVDATGGQLGKGGAWTFSYKLEDNAVVDIIVLSSNSQVGINANGFATYRDTDVVKTVVSSAPRAAEGAGGWTNSDTWNLTDKNNQGVAQGIYTVLFQAHLSTGNPYLPPVDRDVFVMQVTIDKTAQAAPGDSTPPSVASTFPTNQAKLPRVTQVSAVITDTGGSGANTTASSIVLTLKGSTVPIAGVKTTIGDSIFFTLAYSSDGAVATDYVLTVVPVDQAANNGQATVVSFTVDPSSPTIVSVSPSTGTTLTATFTTVIVKLSDIGGAGLDLAGSQITLTNPSGASVTGTVTNNAVDTLTLTVPEQKFNGAYRVTVIARDRAGNVATLSEPFTLNVPLSATTEEFGKTVTVTQNPARGPITVYFDIPAAGNTTFEVFNLLGERVYSQTDSWVGGGRQPLPWNLKNNDNGNLGTGVYTYRVRFTGGGTNLEAKKKLVVVQ